MTDVSRDWNPDRSLLQELNAHLEGPRESWADVEWEQLATVVIGEKAAKGDDGFRRIVLQHAVLLALARSGIPGVGPREAQRLATRFPEPDRLARAEAEEVNRLVPGLEPQSVAAIRGLFGR